jgi:hypothetical protein
LTSAAGRRFPGGTHHQQLVVDAVDGQPRLGVAPASLRASGEQHDVVVERQLSDKGQSLGVGRIGTGGGEEALPVLGR